MKYNWSIIGHEKQLSMIENDIASGNLAHAYLLVGPNSVGKSTVAKKMAGILQCEKDFCHECNTCLQIQRGSHIDTMELVDDKESIKIEEVRKIIERLSLTRQANYKILLIQCLERMTTEATNSFLKTLEEPPEKTIFIMTTNNIKLLLPTIVSRVRVVKFLSVSTKYIEEKLRELFPNSDEDTVKKASLFSLGMTGKAMHLMENPDALSNYIKLYHDINNFLDHKNIVDRFSYVENILADEGQVELFFNMMTHVLRSKILEGATEADSYIKTLSKIDDAGMLLKKNVNPRLVLENLMLSF